ncbi:SURF1 family protein [Roseovarius aestuarii]|uniref:SURF1-like protein n=1 Tax=Roseovarius aestuarii TaxID=475083 RepID=A0A1X7BUN6_9RHOB|nr:SURF1 family protein [Roseovarius aestuarii]SMC13328.1 SURF1 family protein [Roseovarius aestuarii]
MRRILIPLIFGLAGAAMLISLGVWQVQRLAWKEGVLTGIETRIAAEPVLMPENPNPDADQYLPVRITGMLGQPPLRVLVSRKQIGAGYRLITTLSTDKRTILVDLGFIKVDQPIPAFTDAPVTVTGNLNWPDDRNSSTPENDVAGNIWFARDVDEMAGMLGAEPVLLVVRNTSETDPVATPLPVDTAAIPNDHLSYAITWFSLAAIWLVMTGYFLWRTTRKPKDDET